MNKTLAGEGFRYQLWRKEEDWDDFFVIKDIHNGIEILTLSEDTVPKGSDLEMQLYILIGTLNALGKLGEKDEYSPSFPGALVTAHTQAATTIKVQGENTETGDIKEITMILSHPIIVFTHQDFEEGKEYDVYIYPSKRSGSK